MATVVEIRKALDDLETVQARGVEIRARIAEMQGRIDSLTDELATITPAIVNAEREFRVLVQSLDFAKS